MADKTAPELNPIEMMNLPEGRASLSLPANLSAESLQEVEYWLGLLLRQRRRVLGMPVTARPSVQEAPPQITVEKTPATDQPASGSDAPSASQINTMYPGPSNMGGNT